MEVNFDFASTSQEHEEGSLHSASAKRELKDALVHCITLLEKENLIDTESSSTISENAIAIGEELYKLIVEMLGEKMIISEEDLIHGEEEKEDEYVEPAKDLSQDDDPDYEPEEKKPARDEFIPLETKIKVVRLAKQHPGWNLHTLQLKGSRSLKRKDQLKKWEESIKSGGTIFDKYALIDSWTYDRFVEARNNNHQVTTRNLQQWALAAAAQFQSETFSFKASAVWVNRFKLRHRIRQRKIAKYVSHKECVTMNEILEAATKFRTQTKAIIPNFNEKFVINTDQTDCQYEATYDRTLAANKVSHSYTAQYAITLSGELVPHVFLCLQEPTGKFGPGVQKTVDDLLKQFSNVMVTSSKSGKLTAQLYTSFLSNVMLPYVGTEKFLLIIDSWEGQTNPALYDEIFSDDAGLPSCTVKVIPPKCTPLCEPCDVYFYRQIKNFIKRMQTCAYLIENNREINSREDVIKIHAIIHNQLSAPIFKNMLRYAWYASKLSDDRDIFLNVNDVCFPTDVLNKPCGCGKMSFIRCSRCRRNLCFPCLYDNYHPTVCNPQDIFKD